MTKWGFTLDTKTYYVEPPAFEETRFGEGLGEVWAEVIYSGLLDRTIPHCMNTSTAVVSLAKYVRFFPLKCYLTMLKSNYNFSK